MPTTRESSRSSHKWRSRASALTDPVREPAVEKRLVGGTTLGQAEVTLALQRIERAQQNDVPGLAAGRAEPLQGLEGRAR